MCSNSDIEAIPNYSNGIITVGDGEVLTIDQACYQIASSVEFVLQGTAELRIRSSLAKASWNYTGAGNFVSGFGIRFSMFNIELTSSASPSVFIDTFNCTLNLDGCAVDGFNSLGKMEGTGITALIYLVLGALYRISILVLSWVIW